jgi:hypothetical protein
MGPAYVVSKDQKRCGKADLGQQDTKDNSALHSQPASQLGFANYAKPITDAPHQLAHSA